jgi:hypothetical protein
MYWSSSRDLSHIPCEVVLMHAGIPIAGKNPNTVEM